MNSTGTSLNLVDTARPVMEHELSNGPSSVVKFAKVMRFIERPRTIHEIAAHLDVVETTAYRYMNDLETFKMVKQIARHHSVRDRLGRTRWVAVWMKL